MYEMAKVTRCDPHLVPVCTTRLGTKKCMLSKWRGGQPQSNEWDFCGLPSVRGGLIPVIVGKNLVFNSFIVNVTLAEIP